MRITLRVYATLCRYIPGASAGIPLSLELPYGATLADLMKKMGIPGEEVKVAFVNGRARDLNHVLEDGDEAGVFPPVGGG
ncbi:MAG: MoaD/ThiS family protein [Syntrophales bacterium]|nr:MoaD/ThiS family protein [Syntrophales bacterium]